MEGPEAVLHVGPDGPRGAVELSDDERVDDADAFQARIGDGDRPDCLVVSVGDVDWIDVLEGARAAYPTLPVVLEVAKEEQSDALRAAAVAEGVVLAAPADLPEAVENAVSKGREARRRRRASRQLATFFEFNPDPTVEYEYVDGEPIIRAANRAFVEIFGYDRDFVEGQPMNDVIVPPEKAEEAAALDQRVAQGEQITAELRRETTDGQREFLFKNIPTDTDEDGPDGFALYVDISDQKARERRLEEQNERLNDFASVVTHDLRTPMSTMKNHLDIAEHTGDEEHIEEARAALDRMDELVSDLLKLARQGEDLGQTEPVDLSAVAERAWRHVATGDATLVVHDDARIETDSGRLTQLLENLYINAVQHNQGDAPVAVSVGLTEDGDGFFVADDGAGIPPGERDRVFKSGYTTGSDGTGYGLTIVRQVARAHGWDVAVTESDEGGARFEFRDVVFVGE